MKGVEGHQHVSSAYKQGAATQGIQLQSDAYPQGKDVGGTGDVSPHKLLRAGRAEGVGPLGVCGDSVEPRIADLGLGPVPAYQECSSVS